MSANFWFALQMYNFLRIYANIFIYLHTKIAIYTAKHNISLPRQEVLISANASNKLSSF